MTLEPIDMNLREELLKEHSKTQCTKIVNWVCSSQERFDELFECFVRNEYRIVQRAAWPLGYIVRAHPNLIRKHWSRFFSNLQQPNLHNAVKRNSLRFLQDIDIPKKYQGIAMDCCFKMLTAPDEAIAIKVFAMSVLDNLSRHYPDIRNEMKMIVLEQLPHQSTGFKSRAKKIFRNEGLS